MHINSAPRGVPGGVWAVADPMSMIDLTDARVADASLRLIDNGGELDPVLGGPSQRLDRLGTRYALDIRVPYWRIEPDGRRWASRLRRAKQLGARFAVPQVEFNVGAPGSPVVAETTAGGIYLPISGGQRGYAIREGQALNIETASRSYLYFAAAQTILDGDGAGVIELETMIRKGPALGDTINLAKPYIEGWIEGDELAIAYEPTRCVAFEFSIRERA